MPLSEPKVLVGEAASGSPATSRKRTCPPGYTYLPGYPHPVPLLYEDEGKADVGEAVVHTRTIEILAGGVRFHLTGLGQFAVFENLDLHYAPDDPLAYASPDVMAVPEERPEYAELTSYYVGRDGPAPVFVAEVLSKWTYKDGDLEKKPTVYAGIGIPEYLLVDVTGVFLSQRILLKRRQPNGSWVDEQDPDGGVTSALGFRVILEEDGQIRVLDARTGKAYPRPEEALAIQTEAQKVAKELEKSKRQAERLKRAEARAKEKAKAEAEARRLVEERNRALEEELARLKAGRS